MNSRILDKIKKCLALAQSTNPNEAATALRQAQVLMEKHGLTREDVKLSDVNAWRAGAGKAKNPPRYHHQLVSLMAYAFGVEPVYHSGGDDTEVEFIGVGAQPEIAVYCYDVLHRQLLKDRTQYMKSLKRYKRTNKTRKADLYAEGWVRGAASKVYQFAVPPEHKEQITHYIERRYQQLKEVQARKHKVKQGDESALLEGRLAGRNANLHHGMNTDERARLGRS